MSIKTSSETINKLKNILAKYPTISIAYLYGSYAKNMQKPLSDLDIAIATTDQKTILNVSAEISKELNIPEERISITEFSSINPLIRAKILKEGIELVNKNINLNSLLPQDQTYVEVHELEQAISINWLRKDPIDLTIIRELFTKIHEDTRDLKELLEQGYEKVISNKHLRKSFERTTQTLIESIIDLLRHIVAGLNLGVATYYKDYIDYAKKGNIISENLANNLYAFIPIRHALIHRNLDCKELWKQAPKLIELAKELTTQIKDTLKISDLIPI